MAKKLVFGEKAKITTMRLYSWEKKLVREYVLKLRKTKMETLSSNTSK